MPSEIFKRSCYMCPLLQIRCVNYPHSKPTFNVSCRAQIYLSNYEIRWEQLTATSQMVADRAVSEVAREKASICPMRAQRLPRVHRTQRISWVCFRASFIRAGSRLGNPTWLAGSIKSHAIGGCNHGWGLPFSDTTYISRCFIALDS